MRQYIIKSQVNAPIQEGGTIALKVTSGDFPDMRLKSGLTSLYLPFKLELMHPDDENSMTFQFRAPKELFEKGIMMMGAYKEGNFINVALYNVSENEFRLREMQQVLLIDVIERASLKSVKEFPGDKPSPAPKATIKPKRRGRLPL
jgi:hypothetical protein